MWPIAKNGGKLGTAVLQWGGMTNGSSPMLTVFNDWVVSAFSTYYLLGKYKCIYLVGRQAETNKNLDVTPSKNTQKIYLV